LEVASRTSFIGEGRASNSSSNWLDRMNPKFRASIQLHATEDDGRSQALPEGEWHTLFCVGGENWSARLFFSGSPAPGDSFRAEVQLLSPEAYEQFPVGAQFTVWENGMKGTGHVLTGAV
jgi:hypothetical protein